MLVLIGPTGSGFAALASNQQVQQCHRWTHPQEPVRESESLQQQWDHLLP